MPYSTRVDHTDYAALESRLEREIHSLANVRGRTGILIRLHALGDFFSPDYVKFWRRMLRTYDNVAVFGYTARRLSDPIGRSLKFVKREFGRRFAIRWSDGGMARDCTVSRRPTATGFDPLPGTAFQCPEQEPGFTPKGKPILCATCGLCWSTDKNVAFKEH